MSSTPPVSAILGAGFMATVHARAVRAARGRVAALASSRPERARQALDQVGAERAGEVSEVLAAPDVDLVHVCTPNRLHAEQAGAALAAGKHVICEKPIATGVEDARALLARAEGSGLCAAVPFVYRYHPMVREARERIRSGGLGDLLTVDCGYLQDWMVRPDDANWRTGAEGGGSRAFADIGSHLFDLVEFVTGRRVTGLTARTRTVFSERGGERVSNEDLAAVLFELEGGVLGTALVSQMAPGRKNALTLEVHGAQASARFEQERPEELWLGAREGSRLLVRDPETLPPDAGRLSRVPAGHPMGYQDAFNAFVEDVHAAIRGERPEGLPTLADGVRAAILTEAVLASAASGAWTEIPPGPSAG
ncbi:Gfo/Idh/MocA family protein [Rothia halotolerans]|uniref:Gfo/Idh/MocA family protein n=1 Tax=Rothia halotolerans TaxID=405770 RepID=UPI001EE0736D|nr:Gfo/Idh/MocA family oxidoreductase [Rothia halotolerans]